VDCEPLTAFDPDHAPDAVQLVAFVLLQVSIELPPLDTDVGFAPNVTVGVGVLELPLLPPELQSADLTCHPSPPPRLASQADTLPPPDAP
jgi:hypothetical protein